MDHWRQLGIFDPSKESLPIHLIGCGGIGSPTAIALAKMGIKEITLWDNDKIEAHNLPNQFYRLDDLGNFKVTSLSKLLEEFSDEIKVNIYCSRIDEKEEDEVELEGIVISGVDSMKSRKAIWPLIKMNTRIRAYIDGRMGGEVGRILTIDPCSPKDIKFYEKNLPEDEETIEEKCTEKAIIYNTFMIASLICNQVKKVLKSEETKREIVMTLDSLDLYCAGH